MNDLLLSLAVFLVCVIMHIAYCRRASKTTLHAKVFMILSVIGLGVYVVSVKGNVSPLSLKFSGAVLFVMLIPTYLILYVLTQLKSPSQVILTTASFEKGANYDEILSAVKAERFIDTRLQDLKISGCVKIKEGKYQLTPAGKGIVKVLTLMQAFLGREAGG